MIKNTYSPPGQFIMPKVRPWACKMHALRGSCCLSPHLSRSLRVCSRPNLVAFSGSGLISAKPLGSLLFELYYVRSNNTYANSNISFLGQRGPLVLPLVDTPSVRPSARQIWITYIQAYVPLWIIRSLIKPTRWPNGIADQTRPDQDQTKPYQTALKGVSLQSKSLQVYLSRVFLFRVYRSRVQGRSRRLI